MKVKELFEEYVPPTIEGKKIKAYHCGNSFEGNFDLKFSGTGEGYRILGPGTYFITSEHLAKNYVKYAKTDTATMYTVEIDVDNFYNNRLIPSPKMKESMVKIAEALGYTYETLPRNHRPLDNGHGFIGDVVKAATHKGAQKLFLKYGLNGAVESIDYGNGDIVWEIAVFNLDKVKILSREKVEK